jgi:membrane-bound inhibitor of C-type lysozyme
MSTKSLTVLCLAGLLAACKPAAEPVVAPAPVEPAPPAPVEAAVTSVNFQCGDERISAAFDNAAGNVTLSIGGQALTLPQAVAASGARYADDQGNEFWNKGTNATLTRAGQPANSSRSRAMVDNLRISCLRLCYRRITRTGNDRSRCRSCRRP